GSPRTGRVGTEPGPGDSNQTLDMHTRTNLLLFLLVVGGLLGLWWADRARIPDARARRAMQGRVLYELIDTKPEEIRSGEAETEGRRLAFERGAGGPWQMTEPVDCLADRGRVEGLIRNLKDLSRARDSDTIYGRPSGEFGLSPPARR